jgi:2-oxoglutarate dehydrogenase complex dehydrogenase (E1) component-like enzyme
VTEHVEEEADGWQVAVPAVPVEELRELVARQLDWPSEFHPHPKIRPILERRADMLAGGQPVDFATAEALAFATLLVQGVPVRLAGQDSARGTFSQRHSVLVDFENGSRLVPLNRLREGQARYTVVDSLLSEEAALGFEYGYSTERPQALTLWEAQFGDFANGAQVQIDQFLAAGEAKWNQVSALVLLLPHGHDGQGPEHSSARLERFLQLCAQNNLRVANPSTPAQYFHLLRAQALDPMRKPLVVMTPKSLLRQKNAGSTPQELAAGGFTPVLDDPRAGSAGRVARVVCCSGKVYYDLLEARGGDVATALVRVELLYPWPRSIMAELRRRYGKAKWIWCQEEPANMGAWSHVRALEEWHGYAGRPAAASPATGSLQRHKQEQQDLVAQALAGRSG